MIESLELTPNELANFSPGFPTLGPRPVIIEANSEGVSELFQSSHSGGYSTQGRKPGAEICQRLRRKFKQQLL